MYIFSGDYIGIGNKSFALNLAHMRSFYLGTDSRVYFEYSDTWETLQFDTQENATLAYQRIVGMIKGTQ